MDSPRLSPSEIKLVRGTYAVMAREGTQQLSLRAIAKALDVSPPLIGYHFGSRDGLLLATIHWALAGTVRRIEGAVAGVQDPVSALGALLDAVFVGPQENRDFHLVYLDLVQYAARQPSFTGLTALLREHVTGSYAAVIQRGVDAGVFHTDDVHRSARTARAIVEGGFLQWLQADDWESSHGDLRRESEAALLTLLRASPHAS